MEGEDCAFCYPVHEIFGGVVCVCDAVEVAGPVLQCSCDGDLVNLLDACLRIDFFLCRRVFVEVVIYTVAVGNELRVFLDHGRFVAVFEDIGYTDTVMVGRFVAFQHLPETKQDDECAMSRQREVFFFTFLLRGKRWIGEDDLKVDLLATCGYCCTRLSYESRESGWVWVLWIIEDLEEISDDGQEVTPRLLGSSRQYTFGDTPPDFARNEQV